MQRRSKVGADFGAADKAFARFAQMRSTQLQGSWRTLEKARFHMPSDFARGRRESRNLKKTGKDKDDEKPNYSVRQVELHDFDDPPFDCCPRAGIRMTLVDAAFEDGHVDEKLFRYKFATPQNERVVTEAFWLVFVAAYQPKRSRRGAIRSDPKANTRATTPEDQYKVCDVPEASKRLRAAFFKLSCSVKGDVFKYYPAFLAETVWRLFPEVFGASSTLFDLDFLCETYVLIYWVLTAVPLSRITIFALRASLWPTREPPLERPRDADDATKAFGKAAMQASQPVPGPHLTTDTFLPNLDVSTRPWLSRSMPSFQTVRLSPCTTQMAGPRTVGPSFASQSQTHLANGDIGQFVKWTDSDEKWRQTHKPPEKPRPATPPKPKPKRKPPLSNLERVYHDSARAADQAHKLLGTGRFATKAPKMLLEVEVLKRRRKAYKQMHTPPPYTELTTAQQVLMDLGLMERPEAAPPSDDAASEAEAAAPPDGAEPAE